MRQHDLSLPRGADAVQTLATEHALANIFWYRARYQDAEPLYLDVVQRRTRVLGPDVSGITVLWATSRMAMRTMLSLDRRRIGAILRRASQRDRRSHRGRSIDGFDDLDAPAPLGAVAAGPAACLHRADEIVEHRSMRSDVAHDR